MSLNTTELSVGIKADVQGASKVDDFTAALNRTGLSAADLAKQQDKLIRSSESYARTLGKERSEIAAANAERLGVAATMQPIIKRMEEAEAAARKASTGMEHFGLQTAGAKRELLVLAHEILQGNWTRFGGSLMVLGERTNVMSAIFSRTGLAVGGVVAALGTLSFAAIKGAMESSEFAHAMQLTGGYAGVTEGQLNRMAITVGNTVPGHFGAARDAIMGLAKSGQFSGAQMELFSKSVVNISRLSGESTENVIKDFEKMRDGVAKWASEHNKQYHYLTLDQYKHIELLEREGKVEQALALNGKLLDDAMKSHKENLGYLEIAFNATRDAGSRFWDVLKGIGRDKTAEDEIASLRRRLEAGVDNNGTSLSGAARKRIQDEIDTKLEAKRMSESAAMRTAEAKALQSAGVAAHAYNEELRKEFDERYRLNEEIKKYKEAVAKENAASPGSVSQATQDMVLAGIRKKYDKRGVAAENYLERLIKDSNDRTIALEREAAMVGTYGKALDKSREAIAKWNLEHDPKTMRAAKERKGLAEDYLEANRKEDAAQQVLIKDQTVKDIEKKIAAIDALSKVTEHNKIAREEAIELDAIEQKRAIIGEEQANRLIALMKEKTKALRETRERDAEFQEQNRANKEIATIQAQIDSLGKTNEERAKAVAMARELEAAEKRIAEFALTGAAAEEARAKAAAKGAEINAKQDELYQKSRTAEIGVKSFFEEYNEQVTNTAASIKKALTGAFKASEDAMVELVTTGKLNFTNFADSIIKDLIRMALQRTILLPIANGLQGAIGGMFGGGGVSPTPSQFLPSASGVPAFANGGIMTSQGSIPLNKYANGGIANSPQLAMFGEGRHPEAYVPLPDGRSIPVSMKGAGGSNVVNHVNVTVNSDGSSSVSPQQSGTGFARAIQNAIRAEMLNQRRDGGMLSASPAGV